MLGPSTHVELHLLDVKQALGLLEGLRMELEDLASPLLQGRAAPEHCAGHATPTRTVNTSYRTIPHSLALNPRQRPCKHAA